MSFPLSRTHILLPLGAMVLAIGCGGTGGSAPATQPPSTQISVSVTPPTVSLAVGQTQTFKAAVTGTQDQAVDWTATGGAIDGNGLFTATASGSFSVKATSRADKGKSASAAVTVSATGPTTGVGVGQTAVDITGLDSAGKTVTLSSLKGKVVLVGFSTMWCGPCNVAAPEKEALYKELKARGFEIFQVLVENEAGAVCAPSDLARWTTKHSLTHLVVNDPEKKFVATYKIQAYPTELILDRNQVIRKISEGFEGKDKLKVEIEKYL